MTAAPLPDGGPAPVSGAARQVILAFVAGFCDAAAFVGLSGLFVAHVTGNIVLLGVALAGDDPGGLLAKLLALPVFLVSVGATHLLLGLVAARGRAVLTAGLLCEAALLLLFLVCAMAASPILHADAPGAVLAGMAGVAAMGCQNATVREALPGLPSTTTMTAHTSGALVDAIETARGGAVRAAAMRRLTWVVPIIAGFAFGAASGAAGVQFAGFPCLVLPLGLVLAVIPWRGQAVRFQTP